MPPTREIYWNVDAEVLVYLLALLTLGFLAFRITRRVRLWRLGEPESCFDRPAERLAGLLREVFGHGRQLREPYPGTAHLLIFYGFAVQLLATSMIALQEWTGVSLLRGTFYLWFSLLSDSFGLLAIVGLCMALWRRAVRRPAQLHSVMDDWIALALLLWVFLGGFVVEGIRICVTELQQQPGLAPWSPGGYAVALALQGVEPQRLRSLHRISWWLHAISAFALLAYMACGRLSHLWYGLLSIGFRNLDSSGKLTHLDIEARMAADPEAIERLGVGRIDQYRWKSLLELDACTDCGRCEAVCPAHLSGVPLSPRKLIRDLRDHLTEVGGALLKQRLPVAGQGDGTTRECGLSPLFGAPGEAEREPAVLEQELWGCRTCGACQRECPVYVEHVPKLIEMRRYLVMMESRMSDAAQQLLHSMDERLHPWGGAQQPRERWFADLNLKVLGRGDRAEYLFWVGCAGAMIDRNIEVSRAMVKVMDAAQLDFAVLGAEEVCTGDPARRVGAELGFQTCAKANIDTFDRYGVQKIITTCPHCFNSLKHEYPEFGGHYEVTHHTRLIADLLRNGRLKPAQRLDSLTYHDPCYLGRHNHVYDEPREILLRLSTQAGFRELPRSGSRSLCCGGGGGYAWLDDTPEQRINQLRLDDVATSGARTTALACPFCMQMFEEALETRDPSRSLRVADIAELVAEALETEEGAGRRYSKAVIGGSSRGAAK
jgi:Fe-S oxidoreductase/nitrate reductase gamma subunit